MREKENTGLTLFLTDILRGRGVPGWLHHNKSTAIYTDRTKIDTIKRTFDQ
jgi:hypothetical protein